MPSISKDEISFEGPIVYKYQLDVMINIMFCPIHCQGYAEDISHFPTATMLYKKALEQLFNNIDYHYTNATHERLNHEETIRISVTPRISFVDIQFLNKLEEIDIYKSEDAKYISTCYKMIFKEKGIKKIGVLSGREDAFNERYSYDWYDLEDFTTVKPEKQSLVKNARKIND